ncbi:ABC transporter substrate-binding protein [Treponema endosymbiont of Eucomonympha sp.]|uniref:ABC transporter substrate-binding protein n=1 Tax=Treponema endosymbiont of Eucomonympha sp. TaxID=1580831 RepID=UPI000B277D74|nr:transporter substrate-binding domain-containing protein [Treponema endosymbiont of Eucomonympha sp.]
MPTEQSSRRANDPYAVVRVSGYRVCRAICGQGDIKPVVRICTYRVYQEGFVEASTQLPAERAYRRAQKYLYGTVGYTTFPQHLGVREDDFSIRSFDDLKGKTVVLRSTTANKYYVTNKWNEKHGRSFKITFESTVALICEAIASGRADATVAIIRSLENFNREYDAHLRAVQPPVYGSDTYYLFNKRTDAELQKTFDAALKELKDDGTMKKLSLEWLGGDFTAKLGI